jgi:hypothetical protein
VNRLTKSAASGSKRSALAVWFKPLDHRQGRPLQDGTAHVPRSLLNCTDSVDPGFAFLADQTQHRLHRAAPSSRSRTSRLPLGSDGLLDIISGSAHNSRRAGAAAARPAPKPGAGQRIPSAPAACPGRATILSPHRRTKRTTTAAAIGMRFPPRLSAFNPGSGKIPARICRSPLETTLGIRQ